MDVAAPSLVLQRVAIARNLHKAQPNSCLRLESLTHGRVCLGKALGLVQSVVQRIRHILPGGVAIRGHTPVRTGLGLKAANRRDGRANDVLLGGWYSRGLHALQQCRIQLVAVRIVGLLVRCRAPVGLVDAFLNDASELQHREGLAHICVLRGFGVLHGGGSLNDLR